MANVVYMVEDFCSGAKVVHAPDDVQVVFVNYRDLAAQMDAIYEALQKGDYGFAGSKTVELAQQIGENLTYAKQLGLQRESESLLALVDKLNNMWSNHDRL